MSCEGSHKESSDVRSQHGHSEQHSRIRVYLMQGNRKDAQQGGGKTIVV